MSFLLTYFISSLLSYLILREIIKRFPDEAIGIPFVVFILIVIFPIPFVGTIFSIVILFYSLHERNYFQGINTLDKLFLVRRKKEEK